MSTPASAPQALAKIIKFLPTGTVFFFQFVNPIVTNNGDCNLANKILTGLVIGGCFFSCVFACITDRYKCEDDCGYAYGIITPTGIRPLCFSSPKPAEPQQYKLKCPDDFIHLMGTVAAFIALALLDTNTVKCYYPSFKSNAQKVLPAILGSLSWWLAHCNFDRHGIGYISSEEIKSPSNVKNTNNGAPNDQNITYGSKEESLLKQIQ